ncbi:hypothetical protein OH77DRAFT_1429746 [Trametes cingulata]|nr:hypothetical protein OH77DRAFT_1429746 [Trametes cingulata]
MPLLCQVASTRASRAIARVLPPYTHCSQLSRLLQAPAAFSSSGSMSGLPLSHQPALAAGLSSTTMGRTDRCSRHFTGVLPSIYAL